MKIEEYISELLFEHDCVIVPDFGGFVCNYASAGIDPVKHLFEPPSKRILFNKGLTRNDGLLAHHVSNKLKLPYAEALIAISREVKQYKDIIEKNKRLPLDKIGLLYVDEKGNLLFQQDNAVNYLTQSYGLAAFYHLPVEQGNETKVIPIQNERKKIRAYAAAAVISALVVSAFCFTVLEKQPNMRLSSFDFFPKREAAQYTFSPSIYKELPKPVVAEEAPLIPVITATAVNNTPASTVTAPTSYYSVIVGSFSVKENAESLVAQFSKQNIHVSIVGRNPGGLYMVGYGKFPSHDVAAAERDSIRKASVKDAWIKAN